MMRIAVLVSGGGNNLQALIDAQHAGQLGGEIVLVLSSRVGVYALERAQAAGIPTAVVPRKETSDEEFDMAILWQLAGAQADVVVLAGFLSVIGPQVLERYAGRILNVHPSLIPAFCGPGMYGLRVHRAALDYGVKITGATVHMVDHVVDGGEILMQKAVEVLPKDTPETLQLRVLEQAEKLLLPQATATLCKTLEGKM